MLQRSISQPTKEQVLSVLNSTAPLHWEIKPGKNVNLEIQTKTLKNSLRFSQQYPQAQQTPRQSHQQNQLSHSSNSHHQKQHPFKQMKKIHFVPICLQRAAATTADEQNLMFAMNQGNQISPNHSFQKQTGVSAGHGTQIENSSRTYALGGMTHRSHSRSLNNGNQYNQKRENSNNENNEDIDHLTMDSNIFFHITPKKYLEAKFNSNKETGLNGSILSNFNNIKQPLMKHNQPQVDEVKLVYQSLQHYYEYQQDSQSKLKKGQLQAQLIDNKKKPEREIIEPSVIELSSAGPYDAFHRLKLLYFQPTSKIQQIEQHYYSQQPPTIDPQEIQGSPTQNNQKAYQNRRVQRHRNYTQGIFSSVNFTSQRENLTVLTKYMQPVKKHYRVAYQDQSQHHEQMKHLKLNQTGLSQDSNDHQNLVSPLNRLSPVATNQPPLNTSVQDSKAHLFTHLLKHYRQTRVHHQSKVLETQISQAQTRDIDGIFRNNKHEDPELIQAKECLDPKHQDIQKSPKYKHKVVSSMLTTQKAKRKQGKMGQSQEGFMKKESKQVKHDQRWISMNNSQKLLDIEDQIIANQNIISQEMQRRHNSSLRQFILPPTDSCAFMTQGQSPLVIQDQDFNHLKKQSQQFQTPQNIGRTANNHMKQSSNIPSLLKKGRKNRLHFEREQIMAMAIPGYLEYVFDLQ